MVISTGITIGSIILPPLALGKLAPALKRAGGRGGRLAAWVAGSRAGQAVGAGARWVG